MLEKKAAPHYPEAGGEEGELLGRPEDPWRQGTQLSSVLRPSWGWSGVQLAGWGPVGVWQPAPKDAVGRQFPHSQRTRTHAVRVAAGGIPFPPLLTTHPWK